MDTAPNNEAERSEALAVSNVDLIYNEEIRALHNVSLTVRSGEFVSIVGPSGCGKSSLLKLILGLQKATSGGISISGRRVEGPHREVGAVFQSPVLLPWRTVRENVRLPADVLRLNRENLTERMERLLVLAGLEGFSDRYPYELSGGMQQRVGIIRALVHDPKLLIMDEPFAALDALTREQMAQELQRIWMESGKTVLFITHSIPEAVLLSDRILIMSARPGRVVWEVDNPAPRPRSFSDLTQRGVDTLMREIRGRLDGASAA